jgi:hypothetical protein
MSASECKHDAPRNQVSNWKRVRFGEGGDNRDQYSGHHRSIAHMSNTVSTLNAIRIEPTRREFVIKQHFIGGIFVDYSTDIVIVSANTEQSIFQQLAGWITKKINVINPRITSFSQSLNNVSITYNPYAERSSKLLNAKSVLVRILYCPYSMEYELLDPKQTDIKLFGGGIYDTLHYQSSEDELD